MNALEQELRERVRRRAVHLMPQPQTALRLKKVIGEPSHTLAQVVEVVKLDPMLAAAVMRLANSAAQSRGRPVSGLQQAVTRIGEKDLSRLAIASGLGAAAANVGPLMSVRQGAMQCSLASGLICERLAPVFGFDPEALFLDGLLHDVGTLVALATIELIVTQAVRTQSLNTEEWLALARSHHVELGTMLGELWQLPTSVREVIARHHEPLGDEVTPLALVRWSETALDVMRSGAPLTAETLPWLRHVDPAQQPELLEALSAVPAHVAAFQQEHGAVELSQLVNPVVPKPEPQRGLWFPAKLNGGRSGEATLVGPRAVSLRTKARMPDNQVAELELDLTGELLKLWVRFTFCGRPGADGFARSELTPFAPTREVAERLESLWNALQVIDEVAA